MSGRFDTLFSRDVPPLLAFVEPVAARLAGVSLAELTCDGGNWAKHALAAARLIGSSALVLGFSNAVAAEAAGARVDWTVTPPAVAKLPAEQKLACVSAPRWKAFIHSLQLMAGDASAPPLIACMPGPAELCGLLLGASDDFSLGQLKEVMVELADQVCRTRPDSLLLRESARLQSCSPAAYRKAYTTVKNVARYFDVPLGFALDSDAYPTSDLLARLRPDIVVLLCSAEPLPSIAELRNIAGVAGVLGVPMKIEDAQLTRERLDECRTQLAGERWFANAATEFPAQADLGTLRESAALFAHKS